MVPLSVHAYTTLPPQKMAEAAGMNNLIRNLGSSIGISIAATLFVRFTQQGWQQLGGYVNPYNPAMLEFLSRLHLTPDDPLAVQLLAREVGIQAAMASMSKVYWVIAIAGIVMAPLVMLLKAPKAIAPTPTPTPVHE
jgi:DHA2 family multidrug resistance protein